MPKGPWEYMGIKASKYRDAHNYREEKRRAKKRLAAALEEHGFEPGVLHKDRNGNYQCELKRLNTKRR